jgi:hypothetical protein
MSRSAIHSFSGAPGKATKAEAIVGAYDDVARLELRYVSPAVRPVSIDEKWHISARLQEHRERVGYGGSRESMCLVLPRRRKELHVELDDSIDQHNPYAAPKAQAGPVEWPRLARAGIDLARENPFLTIWTRPRATIRGIVDTHPTLHVIPLAMISGVVQALNRASMRNAGDQLSTSTILIGALIGGSIGGLLGLYIGGWFVRITGKWLGGQARGEEVRAAIAWSGVPVLVTIPIWVISLALLA